MERLEQFLSSNKKRLIVAAVISILMIGITWAFFPPQFTETNDDFGMASFSYGYHGEYEYRLLFIHVLIGLLIKGLMTLMPMIPWYSVLQIAVIVVSSIEIVRLALERGRKSYPVFLVFLLFIPFCYQLFSSLQFSKTAGIACVAGFLSVFDRLEKKQKWYRFIFPIALLAVGCMYRFRVFEMLLIPFFGLGCYYLWTCCIQKKDKQSFIRCIVVFVTVFGICVGLRAADVLSYQADPEWAECRNNNALRAELLDHGFPSYEDHTELYESLEMTKNDLALYSAGAYADADFFTKELMQSLVDAKEARSLDQAFFKGLITKLAKGLLKKEYALAGGIVLLLYLVFFKNSRAQFLLLLYEIISFIAIQVYFYYDNRYLQNRVDVILVLALYLIILLFCGMHFRREKAGKIIRPIALAIILAVSAFVYYDTAQTQKSFSQEDPKEIVNLVSSDRDRFYVYYLSWKNLPDKMYDAFELKEKGSRENVAALGNWRSTTPIVKRKMASWQMENPYQGICNNNQAYLYCVGDSAAQMVLTHIKDHYDKNAILYRVKRINQKYSIYKIFSTKLSLDTSAARTDDDLVCSMQIDNDEKHVTFQGVLYKKNINSFATDIYIGITAPKQDKETFYFTTQSEAEGNNDIMNGKYGAFARKIPMPQDGSYVTLYLDTRDALYKVDMGRIGEYR